MSTSSPTRSPSAVSSRRMRCVWARPYGIETNCSARLCTQRTGRPTSWTQRGGSHRASPRRRALGLGFGEHHRDRLAREAHLVGRERRARHRPHRRTLGVAMSNSPVALTSGWRRQLGVTAPLVVMVFVAAAHVLARAWWWAPPYVASVDAEPPPADMPATTTRRRLWSSAERARQRARDAA